MVHNSGGGSARKEVMNRTRRTSDLGSRQLKEIFDSIDQDGDSLIDVDELSSVMSKLGLTTTRERLSAMVAEVDSNQDGRVSFEELVAVVERVRQAGSTASGAAFESVMSAQAGAVMQQRTGNIVHSFAEEECAAFVDFINSKLGHDAALGYLLPIRAVADLFTACHDGVLLCKLINVAHADTVDERVLNLAPPNRFLITENCNLALNAAKGVGIKVVNIGPTDIMEARPHLVLGLVWQLVKESLLSQINLKANPNLVRLLRADESLEELLKLPPEKLLLRWFNHHLQEAGHTRELKNLGADLADSELYHHLLQRIDPDRVATTAILSTTTDRTERAKSVVAHGRRMHAEFSIQPRDIVSGNEKLNLAFVAALFNACPALDPPDEAQAAALLEELPEENEGDSREERAFRMWINSLGLDDSAGFCTNLFDDIRDGVLLLHVMDHVKPQSVEWGKVNTARPIKLVFKRIENLNYAVSLALNKPFGFSLVGVQGKDIADGNTKLTLALIWQLMRSHLVSFLASLRSASGGTSSSDEQMVQWANDQVRGANGATSMRDFSDKNLSTSLFLIDLLAAVEPRCVDRKLVTPGTTHEERQLNAKYAISSARKLGCSLFCTWEDLVDVKPKMVLSFVATLMAFSLMGRQPTTRRPE